MTNEEQGQQEKEEGAQMRVIILTVDLTNQI